MKTEEPHLQFTERILVVVGIVALTILLLLLLFFTFDVVLLVFAAILLAIFIRSITNVITKRVKISDGWAVLLVSALLIGTLAGAIAALTPSVAEQAQNLRHELPRSAQQISDYVAQFGWGQALIAQLPSLSEVVRNINASALLSGVGGFFTQTIGVVGNFLLVCLLAVYLAAEPNLYATGVTKLFPPAKRDRVLQVLFEVSETLRWWLVGKVGSMVFIGILTWIGLSILGIPLALTLGLIAGLLSFIPNFGPIISAVPAILLAFIQSPIQALYVAALYIGVQLIESNLVTPIIERETVELPPALTIIFQLALSVLIGGLGLVLATPILAVVMVLVKMVYIEDVLGDRDIALKEKETDDNPEESPPEAEDV